MLLCDGDDNLKTMYIRKCCRGNYLFKLALNMFLDPIKLGTSKFSPYIILIVF